MVSLIDYHGGSYSESFDLIVHSPPALNSAIPKLFKLRAGSDYEYSIPIEDKSGVTLTHSQIPLAFTNVEKFIYLFSPKELKHLGTYQIIAKLENFWGSITYTFKVEVFNDPPYFIRAP